MVGFQEIIWKQRAMKKIGSLVSFGWLYKRREIRDMESIVGIILSNPVASLANIEKLKRSGEKWDIKLEEKITDQVLVMWPNGSVKYHPVCNLVEVIDYE